MNYKNIIILCASLLGFSGQQLCAALPSPEQINQIAGRVLGFVNNVVDAPIRSGLRMYDEQKTAFFDPKVDFTGLLSETTDYQIAELQRKIEKIQGRVDHIQAQHAQMNKRGEAVPAENLSRLQFEQRKLTRRQAELQTLEALKTREQPRIEAQRKVVKWQKIVAAVQEKIIHKQEESTHYIQDTLSKNGYLFNIISGTPTITRPNGTVVQEADLPAQLNAEIEAGVKKRTASINKLNAFLGTAQAKLAEKKATAAPLQALADTPARLAQNQFDTYMSTHLFNPMHLANPLLPASEIPILPTASERLEFFLTTLVLTIREKSKMRYCTIVPATADLPTQTIRYYNAAFPNEAANRERFERMADFSKNLIQNQVADVVDLFERIRAFYDVVSKLPAKLTAIQDSTPAAHVTPKTTLFFTELKDQLGDKKLLTSGLVGQTITLCDSFVTHFDPQQKPAPQRWVMSLADVAQDMKKFTEDTSAKLAELEQEYADFRVKYKALKTFTDKKTVLIEELCSTSKTTYFTPEYQAKINSLKDELKSPDHRPAGIIHHEMQQVLHENKEYLSKFPPARDTRLITVLTLGAIASAYPAYKYYVAQKKYIALLHKKIAFTALPDSEQAELKKELRHWSIRWLPVWARRKIAEYIEVGPELVDDRIERAYRAKKVETAGRNKKLSF